MYSQAYTSRYSGNTANYDKDELGTIQYFTIPCMVRKQTMHLATVLTYWEIR